MTEKLTQNEVAEEISKLEGWTLNDGGSAITKKFRFKDFRTAWSFMEDIAVEADEMSHHPDWRNVYNRVEVTLTTHDVQGLSELDFDLAHFMDEVAKTF